MRNVALTRLIDTKYLSAPPTAAEHKAWLAADKNVEYYQITVWGRGRESFKVVRHWKMLSS